MTIEQVSFTCPGMWSQIWIWSSMNIVMCGGTSAWSTTFSRILTALVLSKRRTDWSEERTTQENRATKK